MNLALLQANVDFSQWSLSIPGIPVERSDKTGTAMLFDADGRGRGGVQQPPEYERSLALRNRPERAKRQIH